MSDPARTYPHLRAGKATQSAKTSDSFRSHPFHGAPCPHLSLSTGHRSESKEESAQAESERRSLRRANLVLWAGGGPNLLHDCKITGHTVPVDGSVSPWQECDRHCKQSASELRPNRHCGEHCFLHSFNLGYSCQVKSTHNGPLYCSKQGCSALKSLRPQSPCPVEQQA